MWGTLSLPCVVYSFSRVCLHCAFTQVAEIIVWLHNASGLICVHCLDCCNNIPGRFVSYHTMCITCKAVMYKAFGQYVADFHGACIEAHLGSFVCHLRVSCIIDIYCCATLCIDQIMVSSRLSATMPQTDSLKKYHHCILKCGTAQSPGP